MTEAEFIEAIDCRFPYAAPLQWKRLNARAARISPNASFMVVHELCRPPRGDRTSVLARRKILEHLSWRFRHPLMSSLRSLIEVVMRGELVSVATAAAAMRRVARYPFQFNALAICYFACDDKNGRLDQLYESIVDRWSLSNNKFQRTPDGAAE